MIFIRFAATSCLTLSLPLAAQTSPPAPAADQDQSAPYRFHVESNLVVVRAVIRDAQGHTVDNLRKEDFRLFDNGKEQTIGQFFVESQRTASSNVSRESEHPASPPQSIPPQRFLAFYVDDLDMAFDDIVRIREANERYLAANLGPADRVAIFTSSGLVSVNFTSDLNNLREGLSRLRPNSRVGGDCPKLSDYQAKMIVDWAPHVGLEGSAPGQGGFGGARAGNATSAAAPGNVGSDALAVALDEATNVCHMPSTTSAAIFMQAQRVLAQDTWQAQYSLFGLKDAVNQVSDVPGERQVIFLSPGFIASEFGSELDAIVDRALRSQIAVSSIDPRGLATKLSQTDIHVGYTTIDSHLLAVKRELAINRDHEATSVLSSMAESTGGRFFHDDNDLEAALRTIASRQETAYLLSFVPRKLRRDGRFHSLKVVLRDKRAGTNVQARRGYFAPTAEKPEDELAERIRAAVISTEEIRQLPLDFSTEISRSSEKNTGKASLSVVTRLQVQPVHFRKDGDHNRNTLMFVSTIFDRDGLWVEGQQKEIELDLTEDKLRALLSSPGVLVMSTFQIPPGTYNVREVVMDSEEHLIGATSRIVEIPDSLVRKSR